MRHLIMTGTSLRRRLNGMSLSMLILFLSFILATSEAYSQCSTPLPAAPTGLTLGLVSTVAPLPTSAFSGTDSSLVGYWKFDEGSGTNVCDSSGNGNTGTLVNGPLWTTGRLGNGLYFDGVNDNVTVPDSNSLHLSSTFTLSAWVNPASVSTDWKAIIVKNDRYYLFSSVAGSSCSDGSPFGGFSTTQINSVCQSSAVPANTWTYITLTYDGSTLTLYRNALAVATSSVSGSFSSGTEILQIAGSKYGEYFNGLIDEVRIYNRPLIDTEIQSLYKQESIEANTVAKPVISPNSGSYSGSVSVAMQTATSAGSIYYTTNGSTPTQSSTLYTGPFTLMNTTTLKAKAFRSGYTASPEASASLSITQPFAFALSDSGDKSVAAGSSITNFVSATLVSGSAQPVSFSASGLPSGVTASFSVPSCNPSCSTVLNIATSGSTPAGDYRIDITSTGGGVTRTKAFTLSVTLALTVATPTITPNGGLFSGPVSVTMQTATSGASIYYTTDGSTPTQSSATLTGSMTLTSSATVKAAAFKSGYNSSAEATASFTVTAATVGSSTTGKIYYVAKNGNDSNSCAQAQSRSTPMRSIKRGIACLAAGDTLLVRSGNYDERIANWQMMIASGTSFSNAVTIAAFPGESVWLAPATPASAAIIDFSPNVPNQYIIFDGINVDGTNVTGGNSAITPGGTRIRFQNLEVKNTGNGLTSGSAFSVYGSFNEFINLNVHDNGKGNDFLYNAAAGYGFYIGGADNLVERCKIHHNGGYGIHVYHAGGVNGADRNTIRYNQIFDNSVAAQQETSDILLSSGTGNQAYGNLLYRTTFKAATRGISATGPNPKVYNNTVYNYGYEGISTWGSTNGIVRNNIVYNNGTSGQTANTNFSNSPGLVVENNLLSDPKFASPATTDFRLQSGSPAINAGITISEISFDIDGINRPQGAAYDIGAFEYH